MRWPGYEAISNKRPFRLLSSAINMENSDEQLLDSYGQQFLEQFGLPQKRKHESEDDSPNKHARSDSEDEDDGEEWLGIAAAASDTDDDESDKSESETHPSNIIVFEDRNTRSIDKAAEKAQKKMFMVCLYLGFTSRVFNHHLVFQSL